MPALTANDVTVELIPQDRDFLGLGKRISFPVVTFGNGSLTYPTNGVPLPDIGAFGMNKAIKRVFIQDPPTSGYVYKYDPTNHSIRIYQAANNLLIKGGLTEVTEPIGITGGDTLGKTATTDRTILAANSATKGGIIPGPLVEVPTTHAPASTTLHLMVVGE